MHQSQIRSTFRKLGEVPRRGLRRGGKAAAPGKAFGDAIRERRRCAVLCHLKARRGDMPWDRGFGIVFPHRFDMGSGQAHPGEAKDCRFKGGTATEASVTEHWIANRKMPCPVGENPDRTVIGEMPTRRLGVVNTRRQIRESNECGLLFRRQKGFHHNAASALR